MIDDNTNLQSSLHKADQRITDLKNMRVRIALADGHSYCTQRRLYRI